MRHEFLASRARVPFVALAVCFSTAVPIRAQAPSSGRSVWAGVYTDVQARRGAGIFNAECASCHGSSLEGGEMAPALTGAGFGANWNGMTLGDLFERIRRTMPFAQPGKLSRQENADVIAYMLKAGRFPAGAKELPARAEPLKMITFVASRPRRTR